MLKSFRFILLLLSVICITNNVDASPKREFRGAWIQSVNGQFVGMTTATMQKTLSYQLDELQKHGVNAVIFQVRPECDALYESNLEPWSRFLTGKQGKAPSPYWDPLQWMIDECHKRGMELHAWINPYRAKTKGTTELASNHIAIRHPERVFSYDDLLILDPGIKENCDFICKIADDIVSRYDIDGFHIDDYFYPYPVSGLAIPDAKTYQQNPKGFRNINDWRRDNVNYFIKCLSETIHARKPWVKFGVSPFGIYRNKKSDPVLGSNTNGLQNYDDLYADVLLWVNKGWVDYCVPQIYWEIGNKAADYEELIKWWNKYSANRPLYIGEDVERTVKHADRDNPNRHQLYAKRTLHSQLRNVEGTVLWYAKAFVDNVGNYASALRSSYWQSPALQPLMPFIDGKSPSKPKKLKIIDTNDGPVLFWTKPRGKNWKDDAVQYVVYKFDNGEKINIDNSSKIVAITRNTFYKIPIHLLNGRATFVVTSLDRMSNESKPAKKRF